MHGVTRGAVTLVGAALAGFLIWLAAQLELESGAGDFWAAMALLAAAGLTMALSQLAGGWTKWGAPRVSRGVLLLAFLPALIAGAWILLAAMPAQDFNTSNWSRDLGIGGLVRDLEKFAAVIAFALGLILGFSVETAPRRGRGVVHEREPAARRPAADHDQAPVGAAAHDEVAAPGVEGGRQPDRAPRAGPPPAAER